LNPAFAGPAILMEESHPTDAPRKDASFDVTSAEQTVPCHTPWPGWVTVQGRFPGFRFSAAPCLPIRADSGVIRRAPRLQLRGQPWSWSLAGTPHHVPF